MTKLSLTIEVGYFVGTRNIHAVGSVVYRFMSSLDGISTCLLGVADMHLECPVGKYATYGPGSSWHCHSQLVTTRSTILAVSRPTRKTGYLQ